MGSGKCSTLMGRSWLASFREVFRMARRIMSGLMARSIREMLRMAKLRRICLSTNARIISIVEPSRIILSMARALSNRGTPATNSQGYLKKAKRNTAN